MTTMPNPDHLVLKRSPSQQQHSSYLLDKHKLDEKLPIILPTIITHKNSYSSLSEQFRHTKKIDAIQKLQYVISFNPKQEYLLLKEFLNKNGIFNEEFHQTKYLTKLSKFIQNYSYIDPNRPLNEIILDVLRNESDDYSTSAFASPYKKRAIVLNASNKEMLYTSPMKLLQKKKATCVHLKESHSQKAIEKHKMFLKRDMYELINLERQLRINSNNKTDKLSIDCNEKNEDEWLSKHNNEDFVPIEEKMHFNSENNNDLIKNFNSTVNTLKYNESFCNDAKNFLFFSKKIDGNFAKAAKANIDKEKKEILEKSKKNNDAFIYKSLKMNLHQNLNEYKVFPVHQEDYTPRGMDSVIERLSSNNYNYDNNKSLSVKKRLVEFISLEKRNQKMSKFPLKRSKDLGVKRYINSLI